MANYVYVFMFKITWLTMFSMYCNHKTYLYN